jgi:plastocyanin
MPVRSLYLALFAISAAGVALAGCGGGSKSAVAVAPPALITLKNIQFHPAVVRIAVGQSVTWRWADADIDTEHNVTSIGAHRFASSRSKMIGTYTIRFPRAGVYHFECTIHPQSMQGEVIVR